jgi:hypothetical protein
LLQCAAKGFDTYYNGEHVKVACLGHESQPITQGFLHPLQRLPKIPTLPQRLLGKVVLLDNNKLQKHSFSVASRLHHVPALHVPCDQDVDINDQDQMHERAQVSSLVFFSIPPLAMPAYQRTGTVDSNISMQTLHRINSSINSGYTYGCKAAPSSMRNA